MADRFGKYMTNVLGGTRQGMAPGARFNTVLQVQSEVVALDDGGAAAIGTTIGIGVLRRGDLPKRFKVSPTVAIAGLTVSIGTKAAPTKYVNAQAAATATTFTFEVIDATELTANEELYLTTGGAALPVTAGAKLQIDTEFTA